MITLLIGRMTKVQNTWKILFNEHAVNFKAINLGIGLHLTSNNYCSKNKLKFICISIYTHTFYVFKDNAGDGTNQATSVITQETELDKYLLVIRKYTDT